MKKRFLITQRPWIAVLGIGLSITHSLCLATHFDFTSATSPRFVVLKDGAYKLGTSQDGITISKQPRLMSKEDVTGSLDRPTSELPDVLIKTNGQPYGLAYNAVNNTILWTSSAEEIIKQADLDGRNVTALNSNFEAPYLIEANEPMGNMNFIVSKGAILMLTLNKTHRHVENSEELLQIDTSKIGGLALSEDQNQLYFCDQYARVFGVINLKPYLGKTHAVFKDTQVSRLNFEYGEQQ